MATSRSPIPTRARTCWSASSRRPRNARSSSSSPARTGGRHSGTSSGPSPHSRKPSNGSSAPRRTPCISSPTTRWSCGSARRHGTPMTAIIETEKLTKSYGEHRGIIDIDLTVDQGEVFGFLGPNGAGKTTTIRTLLDLIRPTSGRARIFGIETTVDPVAIHRRVGYIPGEFTLYDRLTGGQTLEYFGNLRGGVDPAYRASLIERFDIDPSRRFKEYSKGNKQKIGLVV